MTIHRKSLIVVAGLAMGPLGCASRIGYITLNEKVVQAKKVCAAEVSGTVKVKTKKDPKFYGMAWVVSNQCSDTRDVEIYFKAGVTSPLFCPKAGTPVPAPLKVETGGIGAMSCFVDPAAKPGTYRYGVKGGDQVVDPDLIIKR